MGPILAVVFGRSRTPRHLASWAGLTPRHHESDKTVIRGRITKQWSRLVRWAAVEAAQKLIKDTYPKIDYHRIAHRRGKSVAKVAVAREIMTLVFYGVGDGHIRCLDHEAAA